VLDVFRGAKVVAVNRPLFCSHCDKALIEEFKSLFAAAPMREIVALLDRRRGKVIEIVWPDGRRRFQCHGCGSVAKLIAQQDRPVDKIS
jgi:hypothetical protein